MNRRVSREVNIGSLTLGAQHPIAVQTMYGDPLKPVRDSVWYDSLLFTLRSWATMGASLVRFSYPHMNSKTPSQPSVLMRLFPSLPTFISITGSLLKPLSVEHTDHDQSRQYRGSVETREVVRAAGP